LLPGHDSYQEKAGRQLGLFLFSSPHVGEEEKSLG